MSQFKKKVAVYSAMLAFLSITCTSVYGLPQGQLGSTPNYHVDQNGKLMNITNNDGKAGSVAQGDWTSFSINKGEQVNFGFSNVSQTIINRVLGGEASKILGTMTNSCTLNGTCLGPVSTGKVILINPAGIMFGQGSQVDLNSFTASTKDFGLTDKNGNKIFEAQNLQRMTAEERAQYGKNLNANFSPLKFENGEAVPEAGGYVRAANKGKIEFDTKFNGNNKFTAAKDADMAGKISLDGTTFDAISGENKNKSIAILADNIQYKDSLLRTALNFNYGGGNTGEDYQSFSNVKLITADGATFAYYRNNAIETDNKEVSTNNTRGVERTIDIQNSNIAGNKPAIETGELKIVNYSDKAREGKENVTIKDTFLKADKLIAEENGSISIVSSHGVNMANSRVETKNTEVSVNGKKVKDSFNQDGGEIYIDGGNGDTKISDSLIISSGKANRKSGNTSGNITVWSNKDINLKDTRVVAMGDVDIDAYGSVKANGSAVYAANDKTTNELNNVNISGIDSVDLHNTAVYARGNATIKSTAYGADSNKLSGNVTISSDLDNGNNQAVIRAGKKLSIQGKETKLDNASLVYEDLKFYNDGAEGQNNVTVANNSTFTEIGTDGKASGDINLETNGNLTFDKATVKRASITNIISNEDDGTAAGRARIARSGSKANAVNINATSTEGNVTVQNDSNIEATNNINMTSKTANYTQNKSVLNAGNDVKISAAAAAKIQNKSTVNAENDATVTAANITLSDSTVNAVRNNATLTATGSGNNGNITLTNSTVEAANDATVKSTKGNKVTVKKSNVIAGSDKANWDKTKDEKDAIGDATIEATNGSVYITDGSKVLSQDKDVNIIAKNDINFNNVDGQEVNIDKDSEINALNKVLVKSTNGSIRGEKTEMTTVKYGNRLELNANKDNIFTSKKSLKSENVDYVAGNSNKFYTQEDNQFVNSTLTAKNNFVESGKNVMLHNTEIKVPKGMKAEDVTTEIYANGNVTTNGYTPKETGLTPEKGGRYTYPQDADSIAKDGQATALNINQTKLKVTTQTVKDEKNPDNGSITLNLEKASNDKAGVELTANNVKALDKDSTEGNFRTGYYKSGTNKWDENIKPNEGPEIHLNAKDNKIAIKTLESDKLTLDPNDTKIADKTSGTPVITVRDQGGFNLDPELGYNDDKQGDPNKKPDGYTYDKNFSNEGEKTTGGELTFDDWSGWKEIGRTVNENGDTVITYQNTRNGEISEKITTRTDESHTITFDNNGNPTEFTLNYDKVETKVEPGRTITAEEVKKDPKVLDGVKTPDGEKPSPDDFIKEKTELEKCPPAPEEIKSHDSLIDRVRIPREQVEVSKTSKVVDNTVDQTSNIMSAAAKVDLNSALTSEYDDDDQDDND